ncbi:50S ribosomal protein L4 [Patescibacteria group bacterium]|nr:50S ribosomal protein L4 [Patescibacteria group bacterium]MBU1448472.1 50S ribosomal protein L4 [Patescibacteria group bacterium]MBU2613117.1 50S ribosomal protein L4 [Patescibacteria group bacterium]
MPNVIIYKQDGTKAGDMELSAAHFGVKVNPTLVHEVVVAQQANARRNTGHTKTKGEVSGGGKKPWRQKGTGRARQGSTRNPHWVGGGVAHGPRNVRNFGVKVNRKAKRSALFMALSDKVSNEKLLVLEPPTFAEPKTKLAVAMLRNLPLGRRTLLIIPASNPSFLRMVRNLKDVKLVTVNTLNIVDIVNTPTILFQKDAVPAFEKLYGTV